MTVSRYSVIRYVPDPAREEYVNIGVVVVATDGSFGGCRFTQDWTKANLFSRQNTSFLKDFAQDFSLSVDRRPTLFDASQFNVEQLERMAVNWQNVIQFSEPRASVAADPQRLLDQLFGQFVDAKRSRTPRARDKSVVVRAAAAELSKELARQMPLQSRRPDIARDDALVGALDLHRFDLVVRNGKPLLGAEALSFETAPSHDLDNEFWAAVAAIEDVRKVSPDVSFNVLVVPPPPQSPRQDYERAKRVSENINVGLITLDDVPRWAAQTAQSLVTAATPD